MGDKQHGLHASTRGIEFCCRIYWRSWRSRALLRGITNSIFIQSMSQKVTGHDFALKNKKYSTWDLNPGARAKTNCA